VEHEFLISENGISFDLRVCGNDVSHQRSLELELGNQSESGKMVKEGCNLFVLIRGNIIRLALGMEADEFTYVKACDADGLAVGGLGENLTQSTENKKL